VSAPDILHPVQFRREPDDDYDKAAEYDAKGADETANFGYSDTDQADYQYDRQGKQQTDTRPKGEVF
jgi:hypothetical protein